MIKSEYSQPKASQHWGFCSEKCYAIDESYSQKLKETKLDLLTNEECKILGRTQRANSDIEFCAGKKNFYPKTNVYLRMQNKKGKFWFKMVVRFKIVCNHIKMQKLI